MLRTATTLLVALGMVLAPPATGQTPETELAYTVTLRGLTVAEITGTARETEAAYAAAVRLRSTGLASAFARVSFDMRVEGFRAGDSLRPYRYRGAADTGQRRGSVDLFWPEGGGPVLLSGPPEVEDGVEAVSEAQAEGAQDRLTLLWRLVRPQGEASLCGWQARLFDGARLASLTLGAPRLSGETAVCDGAYTRLAGFPARELAEAATFPFRATYRRRGDGYWELTEASGASIYGPVRIFSRD